MHFNKSESTGEAILNELPSLPGEPIDGSKKDPEKFNLMPICSITRCKLPMMPANAEFYACNHAETLDYLPYHSKCELRCLPGYRRIGPQFTQCWAGGWLKGKHKCVKIPDDELTEEDKNLIAGITPNVVFTQPGIIVTKPFMTLIATTIATPATTPKPVTTEKATTPVPVTTKPVVTTTSVVTTKPVVTTKATVTTPLTATTTSTTTKAASTTSKSFGAMFKSSAAPTTLKATDVAATQSPTETPMDEPQGSDDGHSDHYDYGDQTTPAPEDADGHSHDHDHPHEPDEVPGETTPTARPPISITTKKMDFVVPSQETEEDQPDPEPTPEDDHAGHDHHDHPDHGKKKKPKEKSKEDGGKDGGSAQLTSSIVLIIFILSIL